MLEVINIDESEKWDSIVKSFENYDIYYISGYVKAFMIHGDGEPILFHYRDEFIRAINVVMKRDIEKDENFKNKIESNYIYDLTTPYGYGGFIIEGLINSENIEKLNEEYSKYCISHNIVSEFVRFHPEIKNSEINNEIYEVVDLGKTVTVDLSSKELIWNNLTSKNRNMIRKAIKSGVEIYWGRSHELIGQFIPLYNATMNKDNALEYYYFDRFFYESVLEDLKYNSMIFYALYENKVISSSIILFANQKIHYHLSASDREFQNLASSNLLLYEVACWGSENGYTSFHLGGGLGSEEDNLYKFKKAFNKDSHTYFSIGKKVFDSKKNDDLLNIRKVEKGFDIESTYFPNYRK